MPFNTCVLYPNDDILKFHMSYYLKSHLPMVKENFGQYGLQRVDITEFGRGIDGTKPAFLLLAVMVWESQDHMSRAMASAEASVGIRGSGAFLQCTAGGYEWERYCLGMIDGFGLEYTMFICKDDSVLPADA